MVRVAGGSGLAPQRQTGIGRVGGTLNALATRSGEYVRRAAACASSCCVRRGAWQPDDYEAKILLEGPKGFDRLVIHPGSRWVASFDLLVAIAVTYTAISVPVEVAYRINGSLTFDILFTAVFFLDMLMQFVNGYVDNGYAVLSFEKVALRYAKGWFVVDLVAVIPWEDVWGRLTFLKLIKTVRLLRLRRLLAHTKLMSGGNVVRVVLILLFWLLFAHWFACGFFALGWAMCGEAYSYQYRETWVTTYFDGVHDGPDLSDLSRCGIGAPPQPLFIHVRAMHWSLASMTSLGYGDSPVPRTTAEYIFSMWTQVVGACLYAAIFSNVAKLIEKLDAAGSRFSAALDKISEFAKFYRLPGALQTKLHRYVSFSFDVDRGFDMHEITAMLPPLLQQEVFLNVHAPLVRKVPMFEGCDDVFINQLVRVLRPQVLLKGDCAFKLNDPGDSMYFLKKGAVQITNGGVIYCTLMPGSHFGELSMLTGQRRTAAATAVTDCIMFYMMSKDFDRVMNEFPHNYNEVLDKSLERMDAVMRSNASCEVRMSHAVHKKRILERLSTSKMECFAQATANGLTKTKLSKSCTDKLVDRSRRLSRDKDSYPGNSALSERSCSVTSAGTSLSSSPPDVGSSAERAKEAWAELRALMPSVMAARAEAHDLAAPGGARRHTKRRPSGGGRGSVVTEVRHGRKSTNTRLDLRANLVEAVDDAVDQQATVSRQRSPSPSRLSLKPVGRVSPGGAFRKATSPLRKLSSRSAQVHAEHTPALPPSVASSVVARGATRIEAGEDAATPPGLLSAKATSRRSSKELLEGTPAEGTGERQRRSSRDLDDDGRCVGALRAQLRASAARSASDLEVGVDPWNQSAALASLGSGSGSISSSSSRRPSNEPRRPSCCSCASDELATSPGHHPSEAASLGSEHLRQVPSAGSLQEIHSVLHGVLLELRELKAAQRQGGDN